MNGNFCFCPKCAAMERDFEELKGREATLRQKVNEMSLQIAQIVSQKQLLERQNRILIETCKNPIREASVQQTTISYANVSKIMNDFDDIFQNQGNDIERLINDRNRLSSAVFSSIQTIDNQSKILLKYDHLVHSLLSFINNQQHASLDSIQNELNELHIWGSIQQDNQNVNVINEIDSYQQILGIVERMSQSSQCKKLVSDFIIEQKSQLEEANNKASTYRVQINEIYEILSTKDKSHSYSIKKIKKAITEAKGAKNAYMFSRDLVFVCVSFADQFFKDKHIKRCTTRLKKWLDDGDKSIDVIQEIDFLLGLCFPLTSHRHSAI